MNPWVLMTLWYDVGVKYMSKMIDTKIAEAELVKRDPTSLNIDSELWREVKKMAIDKGVTATEYLEQALREKLSKDKSTRK
jgi:hypothetical protein